MARTCVQQVLSSSFCILDLFYLITRDETLADRLQRIKSSYQAHGLRAYVEVELFKHPHLLLLQSKNSIFKLPGGRITPAESVTLGIFFRYFNSWVLTGMVYDKNVMPCRHNISDKWH
ncbi:pre-mRNA cleavage factor Im 25 kDa subunit 1-like isoform X4 [Euphorbia lathyris]|uniref:pre-mRNA cleavage factor Im 25 kDa subunit 1-like isoform X4 n=1 Tax=Euphorbia lathyris TaxID=212925 RepID=UPI0033142335